uniref:glutathione transferase n=1 Tax=Aegilops tauschii subsp. strangulata TaxID=200361 RepID=A0A453T7R3_AEGTS
EAKVKVFGPARSTCVARVLVCLEEVGAEYELVHVHLPAGEHKGPAHLARTLFGQVPAFQDGDLILFDLLRENSLAESATVDAWLEAESHNFDRAMSAITFQCFVVPMFMGGTTDHKIVEENMEKLKAALGVYEERLTRFKYLAGDFISLADLSHCPMAHYLLASPCASVLDAYPRVKDWVDGMMDRPSVKKVMELMDA